MEGTSGGNNDRVLPSFQLASRVKTWLGMVVGFVPYPAWLMQKHSSQLNPIYSHIQVSDIVDCST